VDMSTTLPAIDPAPFVLRFVDTWQPGTAGSQFNVSGAADRFVFNAEKGELRICLAWTDPPGRGLQNTIHVFLVGPASGRWNGNEKRMMTLNQLDKANNLQVIRVPDAAAGAYTVMVSAADLLFAPQSYALVVTGQLTSDLVSI